MNMTMTNTEIREIIFQKIKELGFKIWDESHPDGYFICDMGEDSVTHFRLKGHGIWKHWRFGLWIDASALESNDEETDYEPKVVQLFAQYDTQIDKFKPTRSSLLFELNKKEFSRREDSFTFYDLREMLKMMCKHPFMCYGDYCGNYCGYTDRHFVLDYIRIETKVKLRRLEKKIKVLFWLPYTKLKVGICKRAKFVDSVVLHDFEKENPGWKTSYLYSVDICFSEYATNEQIVKIMNFWRKEKYGKFGYYDFVVEVDGFRIHGKKGRFKMCK